MGLFSFESASPSQVGEALAESSMPRSTVSSPAVFFHGVSSPAIQIFLIFGGSPGMFRTRWNKLLLGLGDYVCRHYTSWLRAGGTAHLYRSGLAIAGILWALREKNIETLQHYLQEVVTQITIVDLPQHLTLFPSSSTERVKCYLRANRPLLASC